MLRNEAIRLILRQEQSDDQPTADLDAGLAKGRLMPDSNVCCHDGSARLVYTFM